MKVIKAQTAGFCFGVKRAVDQVYDLAAKEKEPVYTYCTGIFIRLDTMRLVG